MVAGQVLQSAPTIVETKENVLDANVGAILYGRPATEDKHAQMLPSSDLAIPAPQPPTPEEDDDEEVSWQSAARASLEKEPRAKSKEIRAESQEQRVENQKSKSEPQTVKQQTPQSSPNPKPQTPNPEPPLPTEQFTREELPADFWGNESEPPPSSSYDDDEAFETATSMPNGQSGKARGPSKSSAKLPFDMPLFNELQALFPGRIVRIDMKQQKQAEESEEASAQANETVSVVESEENE